MNLLEQSSLLWETNGTHTHPTSPLPGSAHQGRAGGASIGSLHPPVPTFNSACGSLWFIIITAWVWMTSSPVKCYLTYSKTVCVCMYVPLSDSALDDPFSPIRWHIKDRKYLTEWKVKRWKSGSRLAYEDSSEQLKSLLYKPTQSSGRLLFISM